MHVLAAWQTLRGFGTFMVDLIADRPLAQGAPGQVREEVLRRCHDLAPGGGFVFCQVYNIPPDVPPENMLAM